MKGSSLFLTVLLLVLAVPLMAVSIQGNTGVKFSAISILEVKGETINQVVAAPVYIEAVCLLPDDKNKIIPLLEFTLLKPSHSPDKVVIYNGRKHTRISRIKSGRH